MENQRSSSPASTVLCRGLRLDGSDFDSYDSNPGTPVRHRMETVDSSKPIMVVRKIMSGPGSSITAGMRVVLPSTHREISSSKRKSLTEMVKDWKIPKLYRYDPSMITVIRHPRGDTTVQFQLYDSDTPPASFEFNDEVRYEKLSKAKEEVDLKLAAAMFKIQRCKKKTDMKSKLCDKLVCERNHLSKEVSDLQARISELNVACENGLKSEDSERMFVSMNSKIQSLENDLKVEKQKSEKKDKAIENLKKQLLVKKEAQNELKTSVKALEKEKLRYSIDLENKLDLLETITEQLNIERLNSAGKEKSLSDLKKKLEKTSIKLAREKEISMSREKSLATLAKDLEDMSRQFEIEKDSSKSKQTSLTNMTNNLKDLTVQLENEKQRSDIKEKAITNLTRELSASTAATAEFHRAMDIVNQENGKLRNELRSKTEEFEQQLVCEKRNSDVKDASILNLQELVIGSNKVICDLRIAMKNLEEENQANYTRAQITTNELQNMRREHEDRLCSLETQNLMQQKTDKATIAMLNRQLELNREKINKMNGVFQNSFEGPTNKGNVRNPVFNIEKDVVELIQLSNAHSVVTASGEKVNECLQEIMNVIGALPEKTSCASTQSVKSNPDELNVLQFDVTTNSSNHDSNHT